jgi:hypothetical protein
VSRAAKKQKAEIEWKKADESNPAYVCGGGSRTGLAVERLWAACLARENGIGIIAASPGRAKELRLLVGLDGNRATAVNRRPYEHESRHEAAAILDALETGYCRVFR